MDGRRLFEPATSPSARLGLGALVVLYLVVVTHAAWLSDDAFIAFRAADNALRGFGLVSNPPERVQAFTSPLATLVFLLGHALHPSAYAVGIAMGLSASALTALFVGFRLDAPPPVRALALLALTLSAAVVDFSTSGLENPLSHLLVVLLSDAAIRAQSPWLRDDPPRYARRAFALVGLIGLCRLDLLLLVLPATVALVWRRGVGPSAKPLALGLLPLLAWEIFAVVYYGFPYPNTAYAKLNVAIPQPEVIAQGLVYLRDSLERDPLTLGLIALALPASALVGRRRALPVTVGAALYLGYVVWVGGDFMSGRFLSVPFVASLVALCHVLPAHRPRAYRLAFAGLAIYAIVAPLAPFRPRDTRCIVPPTGVVDERACYEEHTALRHQLDGPGYAAHDYYRRGLALRQNGPRVSAGTLVGLTGYAAGPHRHIVDLYALTDPLLARRSFVPKGRWRMGHFYRHPPAGYLESVESGENRLVDPEARAELDELWTVVRGPLWTRDRWRAIARLNFDP